MIDKVILHIGDKVTHNTLGEGTVTIVDEDYVTIKFESEELTFRLPDAFENGFLTSEDAEIIEEEDCEDEEVDEEDTDEEAEDEDDEFEAKTPVVTPSSQKNKMGCLGSFVAIGIPAGIGIPLIILFMDCYFDSGGKAFIVLSIICLLLMALFIFIGVRALMKPLTPAERRTLSGPSYDPGPSPGQSLLLGLLGGYFLDKALHKDRPSIFDKARDDLFWQEKARRHDDYYDGGGW